MSPKAGSSNLNEPEFGVKGKLTIKTEPSDRKPVEPSNRALVTAPRSFAIRFREFRPLRRLPDSAVFCISPGSDFFMTQFFPFPDSFASTAVVSTRRVQDELS